MINTVICVCRVHGHELSSAFSISSAILAEPTTASPPRAAPVPKVMSPGLRTGLGCDISLAASTTSSSGHFLLLCLPQKKTLVSPCNFTEARKVLEGQKEKYFPKMIYK